MATRPTSPSTEQVIAHVRDLIGRGHLRAGDRLPAERHLVTQLGVSRPTVRSALRALAAMGVVEARHGSGTYIPGGPPKLDSQPLSFLAALHGFTRDEMFEARRVLEVSAAGLAAERASGHDLAAIAEEVASLFANMEDPQLFLVHDMQFHRAVAVASRNPILASLIEMVSTLFFEHRRPTAARATDRNLRDAADMHQRIYRAIRQHDAEQARTLMDNHLRQAAMHHAEEAQDAVRAVAARPAESRRRRNA
ncbi:MAG TPA: FadR/GntR family transcriptional regulator [Vicinamibacterales bacterium]|nr:FadR/GntR family transcriptional regulator [Vicinamibacterales bacterium]